jgi:hypothetical protein
MNTTISEQRKYTRLELSYPLKLTLFSPYHMDKSFIGCFKNVSTKGACIQLEDRYNRFAVIEKRESRIELTIDVPQGEQISLNTRICWIKKDSLQKDLSVLIGLEFEGIKEKQLEQIKRLSGIKKKDHQMLNDLFDHYVKQPFRF